MADFNPNAGGEITLQAAAKLTRNFRIANPGDEVIKAHYFGNDIIDLIRNQPGSVGIRIYYGIDDEGANQLVLTGVDSNGDDMYNGVLGDLSAPCPTECDNRNSPLLK